MTIYQIGFTVRLWWNDQFILPHHPLSSMKPGGGAQIPQTKTTIAKKSSTKGTRKTQAQTQITKAKRTKTKQAQ